LLSISWVLASDTLRGFSLIVAVLEELVVFVKIICLTIVVVLIGTVYATELTVEICVGPANLF
jgi:hypothetical protein